MATGISHSQLVERLRAEQCDCWRQGQRILVEAYLDQHPSLQADPESVLELVCQEWLLREGQGDWFQLEEYLERFPLLTPRLQQLFVVHRFLESDAEIDMPARAATEASTPAGGAAVVVGPVVPGYEILGTLGHGGMGVVYRARQIRPTRLVALKMIRAGRLASPAEVRRFRTEAEAAAHLDHPHVVPIYEVGEHAGLPYFSMKLLEGGGLDRQTGDGWGVAGGKEGQRRAARLLAIVTRAVHYGHQRGILHRDLKPANILLDAQGQPYVTDFGLAKHLGSSPGQTDTGQVVGTPSYMAPEQALGRPEAITTAADVYSLGAILYELLTGRPPFRGETALETLRQVQEREPDRPRAVNPEVDRDLETICLTCLDKERGRRYGSAEALAEDLERWLGGEPIRARRSSVWERSRKWARRQPALAALIGVTMLATAALALGGVLHHFQLRDALETARSNEAEAWKQKQTADEQRARADRHLLRATRAVQQMLTEVGDQRLVAVPQMEDVRKKLLEQAVALYLELSQEESAHPGVQQETARAFQRLSKLYLMLGQPDQAEEALGRALAVRAKLAEAHPEAAEYQLELAATHNNLGFLYGETQRSDGAGPAFEKALALLEQLDRSGPHVPAHRSALASTYNNLADWHRASRRPDQAREWLVKAVGILEPLVREHPGDPTLTSGLATAANNLAQNHRSMGHPEDAEAAFLKARGHWQALAKAYPEALEYQHALATVNDSLGDLYRATHRLDEAEAALLAALAVRKHLAADHPKIAAYQQGLANSHHLLGVYYHAGGRRDEAETSLREAQTILEAVARDSPQVSEIPVQLGLTNSNLGRVLVDQGKPEAALESYARAIAVLGPLRQIDSRWAQAKPYLLNAHVQRALILSRLDRHAEALSEWDQALAVDSDSPRLRLLRAGTLARLGDHAKATALASALGNVAGTSYDAARVFALASAAAREDATLAQADRSRLSEQHALRALELLAQAQATGYFQKRAAIDQLAKDSAFAPLRSRDDYTKWLQRLKDGAKAGGL
jgi:tetratricopeptide (TPR) repeat protein